MCRAFSCLVTKGGGVIWRAGVDSHDKLYEMYRESHKLRDDTTEPNKMTFARVEIVPDNTEKYKYLYPDLDWKFKVDEDNKPRWLKSRHEGKCWDAFEVWRKQVYEGINLREAINPVNPFTINCDKVTSEHIELLRKWSSVRDSVG